MLKYIIKRLLMLIIAVAGCTFIIFMLMRLAPIDPPDPFRHAFPSVWHYHDHREHREWRKMHGLNDPVPIQYLRYMARFFTGNFGSSFRSGVSITEEVMTRIPYTLRLSFAAFSFSVLLAVPIGVIAAVKRNTWVDRASISIAFMGISMPLMWPGMFLVIFFSLRLGWLPSTGEAQLNSVILPGMVLGYAMLFTIMLTARSSMLDIMGKDYIRTARAKGLSKGKIIFKHALPNIIIPVLASFKAHLGVFFTYIIITEYLFLRPGIGRLMMQSIAVPDYRMLLACLIVFILFFAFINFIVDIAKAFADPVMRRGRLC